MVGELWFVNGQPAFARPMQPALRRDKHTEAYPRRLAVVIGVLVVANVLVVLKLQSLVLRHKPHFSSTYLATAITKGGPTAMPSLSPMHAGIFVKEVRTRAILVNLLEGSN